MLGVLNRADRFGRIEQPGNDSVHFEAALLVSFDLLLIDGVCVAFGTRIFWGARAQRNRNRHRGQRLSVAIHEPADELCCRLQLDFEWPGRLAGEFVIAGQVELSLIDQQPMTVGRRIDADLKRPIRCPAPRSASLAEGNVIVEDRIIAEWLSVRRQHFDGRHRDRPQREIERQ